MSESGDAYEKAVMKGMTEMAEKLFPQEVMDEFALDREADVAAGTNVCICGEKTMQSPYPGNGFPKWCCKNCAQAYWEEFGSFHGNVMFDMNER